MLLLFRTSIKQIQHKKLFFLLMLCLLTATLFLVSTFSYLFFTSYESLKDIKSNFPVSITTQIKSSEVEYISPELLKAPYDLFLDSNLFKTIDSNLYLSGELTSYQRLPNKNQGERSLEDRFFFIGTIHNIQQKNNQYILNVNITTTLFGILDTNTLYQFELTSSNLTLSQLDSLMGTELYLEAFRNNTTLILLPSYLESPIPVEKNVEDTIQSKNYYSYMHSLQSLQLYQQTYPILLTQNLESYEPFANNTYHILEGTAFHPSDYNSQPVCLVSSELAKKHSFTIGDTITVDNIGTPMDYQLINPHYFTPASFIDLYQYVRLNYESIGSMKVSEALHTESNRQNTKSLNNLFHTFNSTYSEYIDKTARTYKIIGMYGQAELSSDPYYLINNNTIIIPTNTNIPIMSFDETVYPHLNTNSFSYSFKNPEDKDTFFKYLTENNFDFSKYDINIIDHGYYQLSSILVSMQNSSFILLTISSIALLMLIILFLYFYFESTKRIFVLNRILGNTTLESMISLCTSSHLIYIISMLLTLVMNYIFSQKVYNIIYTNTVNKLTESVFDGVDLSNVVTYKWNLTYYTYTNVILCSIYLLIYFIFSHIYFNKSLIRLVKN